jgi:hypothetical protein
VFPATAGGNVYSSLSAVTVFSNAVSSHQHPLSTISIFQLFTMRCLIQSRFQCVYARASPKTVVLDRYRFYKNYARICTVAAKQRKVVECMYNRDVRCAAIRGTLPGTILRLWGKLHAQGTDVLFHQYLSEVVIKWLSEGSVPRPPSKRAFDFG